VKRGSTMFLRGTVLLIGLFVLVLCVFVVPIGIRAEDTGGYRAILAGLYVPAIPFFFALYQTLKLLDLIDHNDAFSGSAVKTLHYIKYSAITISALFAAGMPYVYIVAKKDDAPGVIVIGLVIILASIVVATFAAVLQKLLQNAMDIKSENDLTV
jgi:Protein of unknown function (DUF2975)